MKIKILAILIMGARLFLAQSIQPDTTAISINQAVLTALKENEQLLADNNQTLKAELSIDEAKADFLPKVDFDFSYVYNDIVPGFKKLLLGNIEHDLFPRVSVSQIIFEGGKLEKTKLLKELALTSQKLSYQQRELSIKLLVNSAYYKMQTALNQIEITRASIRQLKEHKRFTKLLVDAGKLSKLELNRIDVEISDLNNLLLNLQNNYSDACYNLNLLMGKNERIFYLPADSLTISDIGFSKDELIKKAIDIHPSIQKFNSDIKKAEVASQIQKAAYSPKVSALAYLGYEFGLEQFSFDDNKRYFVGLNLKMPIYDGGKIKSKVEQANKDVNKLKFEKSYFIHQLSVDVENLYNRLIELNEKMDVQKKSFKQIQDSYRLALLEYQAGRRSNTDLLDIQKSLFTIELGLNSILINYNLGKAQLLYKTGLL